MTDPGAPPLNLKEVERQLEVRLEAASQDAVDWSPKLRAANADYRAELATYQALLRALRETRAALHQIFEEASGFADWAHARRIKLLARDVLGRVDD